MLYEEINLKEQLSSTWIEYKDGTINGFCSEIPFKCLMDCHTIHIGVINKPNDLVAEDLPIVLG